MDGDSELFSTGQWIQFFRNAGLPSNVAANYALIFSDNRIQINMLLELSKEYLFDMGIKVMGDVIAILRYSKEFTNQLAKEKMIGCNIPASARRNSPASRILGHYTRPALSTSATTSTTTTIAAAAGSASSQNFAFPKVLKRSAQIGPVKSMSQSNKQKVRRITPEDEGAYKIKMPMGTTERTRKILEQQKQFSSKKSVFHRLGESDVSSSTDVKRTISSGSVFHRLGPSSSEVTTSSLGPQLGYQGVLKAVATRTTITSPKVIRTIGGPRMVQSTVSRVGNTSLFKRIGPKTTVQTKRLVINSRGGLQGVSQINSILQHNAQINSFGGQNISARIRGVKQVQAGRSVLNRLGTQGRASIRTGGMQKKLLLRQQQTHSQGSVFQRLGT